MLRTASFSPEDNERLATAYEDALRALHLANRADPVTTIIARRIIDAGKIGERDPARLCALAIKDLSASKPPPRQPARRPEGSQSG
jgi:hypothetical protein